MTIYLLSTVKTNMKKYVLPIVLIGLLGAFGFFAYNSKQIPKEDFLAPGKSWQSPKKVEDYFVEKLRFTQADLERQK